MARMVWNAITSEYLKRLRELPPQQMAAMIQLRDAHTKYGLICDQLVTFNLSTNELFLKVERFLL